MKSIAYKIGWALLTALELVLSMFFSVFIVLGGLALYTWFYFEEWMDSRREDKDET